jgi:hypothetical protein
MSASVQLLAGEYGCSIEDLRRLARRIHVATSGLSGLRW